MADKKPKALKDLPRAPRPKDLPEGWLTKESGNYQRALMDAWAAGRLPGKVELGGNSTGYAFNPDETDSYGETIQTPEYVQAKAAADEANRIALLRQLQALQGERLVFGEEESVPPRKRPQSSR